MKFQVVLLTIIFLLISTVSYAYEDKVLYNSAKKASKSGSIDFAFMHYRTILRDHPKSKYRERAIFGLGEYYFLTGDYTKAKIKLRQVLTEFPETEAKMFVLVYLLKIAQIQKNTTLAAELEREIVSLQRVSFVFRDFKEYEYETPLYRSCVAVFYIDKIEFFMQGALFAEIVY